MTYQQARQYLDRFPRFEVKPGLQRIERLLDALGRPQLAHPTIHVGGTNGKGSVVAMLDAVLRAAGLKVGRFTSPELIDFRDRIALNGEWISEADLTDAVERLIPLLQLLADVPSQFEIITAIAFDVLARSHADISVIEVGLGGRFDATNGICPELAILTNVTLDHQAILGDTVEKIAWEKAGIAKAGQPMLTAGLPESVLQIVRAECEAVGAILTLVDDIAVTRVSRDWDASIYDVNWDQPLRRIRIPLIGSAQGDNLRLVLGAIRTLRARGWNIPDEAILAGLGAVFWPGRMEVVRQSPTILLDGAHNEAAMKVLTADLSELVPDPKHRFLLYGVLGDKDVDAALSILKTAFSSIGLCVSDSPRALPMDRLVEKARGAFQHITAYHTIAEGIQAWLAHANPEDVLVITGSLTVVAAARRRLMEGM